MARKERQLWFVLLAACLMACAIGIGIGLWSLNVTRAVQAELILRIHRPVAMSQQEYEEYRNAQRKIMISDFVLRRAVEDPLVARTEFVARHRDPVAAMSSAVTARNMEANETTRLTFRCRDSDEAETILNEIVDEYLSDVVVVARVQREELLRPVQRTRDKIAARVKLLRMVLEEVNAATKRNVTQLTAWREELTAKQLGASDESRSKQLDEIVEFATERMAGPDGETVTLLELVAELNAAIERREVRLAELTADLAEWNAHELPRIEVLQHAKIVESTR